jgi:hypothetical protein
MIGTKWTDLTPEIQEGFSKIFEACSLNPKFYKTAFIDVQKGMSAVEAETNQKVFFTTEMKDAVSSALINLSETERISYHGVDIVKHVKTYGNMPAYFVCCNSTQANAQIIVSVF